MSIMTYRELATLCRYRAANAPTDDLREQWLRLANLWLVMAIDQVGHGPGGNIRCLFEVSGMNADDSSRGDPESPRSQISPPA
jgi:hypothetical protein